MKGSTGDGVVLKDSRDHTLGVFCNYIPEYNLHDMTSTPQHFLDFFDFRALTPLYDQLYFGTDGAPGDRELMEDSSMRYKFAPKEARTVFIDGYYGSSLKPTAAAGGVWPDTLYPIEIPSSIGQLIIMRQGFLFQYLNHIVEEILNLGSETRNKWAPEKTPPVALATAFSNLNVIPRSLKISYQDVLAHARAAQAALGDYMSILCTESVVLNQAVNTA